MKKFIALVLALVCVLSLISCNQQGQQDTTSSTQSSNSNDDSYESIFDLEIVDGKLRFHRTEKTPRIVYEGAQIYEISNGTTYEDGDDILTAVFQAMDRKDAVMDVAECEPSYVIYMFDSELEDGAWQYKFSISTGCKTVVITKNKDFSCTIELSDDEIQMILDSLTAQDN